MGRRSLLVAGLAALAAFPAADASARTGLRAFANCDQLVAYARARAATAPGLVQAGRPGSPQPVAPAAPTAASPTSAGTQVAEPDFSGTNVQEAGIDGPD